MPRKKPDPVVEETKDEVDYRDAGTGQFVTEEYADEHPDTTVGETSLPEGSNEDQEQAFKQWVVETLNGFDERIRDIEVVTGNQFLSAGAQQFAGRMVRDLDEAGNGEVQNGNPGDPGDDDVPEYIAEFQNGFAADDNDGTPWLS